jgi:hypothetical protein
VDEESATSVAPLRYGNDSASEIENANLPIVHERVPLHKLKQVSFDVGSNDTVGFNDGTRFGINNVPSAAYLRL